MHEITDDVHTLDRLNCTLCGQCVEVCPNNALKIYGKEYSVDEIFNIVRKDKEYYQQSGGGATVSGGEPLQQYRFVIELFQKLKEVDIHTCLDTSGFANSSILEHIIPWTDLFLFDYKLSKEEDYCQHTNMNLETINQSLKLLFQYSKQVILRCPIVPGINDNDLHFESIRSIATIYPNIRQVDIIPYHQLGEQKHLHIGNKNSLKINERVNLKKVELMQKKLENQLGIPIVLSKGYAH